MFTLVRIYVRVELSKNVSPYHDVIFLKVKFFATIRNSSFDTRTNPRTYDNNSSIAETNSKTRKTIYNLTIIFLTIVPIQRRRT